MKSSLLKLFLLMFLSLFPITLFSQNVGIVPFKITSDKYNYPELSEAVSGMITTKLALSSNLHLIPIDQIEAKVKELKIPVHEGKVTDEHLEALKKAFNLDYLLTGEVKLTSSKLILKGKLFDYGKDVVIEKIVEDKLDLNLIYSLTNQLTNKLFENITLLSESPAIKDIVERSNDVDLMLLYNSNPDSKILLNTINDNIEKILEGIKILNPCPRVRIALVDVNPCVQNLPRILDFTFDIEEVKTFLKKSIQLTDQPGIEVNEEYAIDYCIKNSNWTVSNHRDRYLFILGSVNSSFPKKVNPEDVLQLAMQFNVKIYPLGGFETPVERKRIYTMYAERTGGSYREITYKTGYEILNKGFKYVAIKDNQLYMFKLIGTGRDWTKDRYLNPDNVIDLSFGEKVGKFNEIKDFLKKRGLSVIEDEEGIIKSDNNIDSLIIQEITDNYTKWQPQQKAFAQLTIKDATGYVFPIEVGNKDAVETLKNLKVGDPVFVGGQVIPTTPYKIQLEQKDGSVPVKMNFFLNSPSIIINKAEIKKDIYYHPHVATSVIRSINVIKSDPSTYSKYGIFDIPRWFIFGTIKSISFSEETQKTEDKVIDKNVSDKASDKKEVDKTKKTSHKKGSKKTTSKTSSKTKAKHIPKVKSNNGMRFEIQKVRKNGKKHK